MDQMNQNSEAQQLIALTADETEKLGLELDQIWFVKFQDSDEKHGPFTEEMLKNHLQQHPELLDSIFVCNQASEDWVKITELSQFKMKKPQLATIPVNNEISQYFLLIKGQKSGPFNHEEVMTKLKNKDVLFNDFISEDKGYNWFKLYEVHGFDRREEVRNDVLPVSPSEETFGNSRLESLKTIEESKDSKDILAFIATSGRRKVEDFTREVPQEEHHHTVWFKNKKMVGGLMSVMVVGMLSFYSLSKKPATSETDVFENFANVEADKPLFPKETVRRKPASMNQVPRNYQAPIGNPIARPAPQVHHMQPPEPNQEVNYDDPPAEVVHEMAPAVENRLDNPPEPPAENYADGGDIPAPAEPAPETMEAAERLPANEGDVPQEPLEGQAPVGRSATGSEQEIFNQEVEN